MGRERGRSLGRALAIASLLAAGAVGAPEHVAQAALRKFEYEWIEKDKRVKPVGRSAKTALGRLVALILQEQHLLDELTGSKAKK